MTATEHEEPIVIRPATPADEEALVRLAVLDSASPLDAPALLAEVGGELRAALSRRDGRTVADPFYASAGLVALLRVRAELLRGHAPRRHEPGRRARLGTVRAAA